MPEGVTGYDVATDIGPRLAKAAVAVTVDSAMYDLHRPIGSDATVSIVTANTEAGRHVIRHSAAHIMAQAVLDLFPRSTYAIGPAIQDGFYYDFEVESPFTPEDLERIEARMREIVAADQPFERGELSIDDALKEFANHPFKREIIVGVDADEGVDGNTVSTYRNDAFLDLCRPVASRRFNSCDRQGRTGAETIPRLSFSAYTEQRGSRARRSMSISCGLKKQRSETIGNSGTN